MNSLWKIIILIALVLIFIYIVKYMSQSNDDDYLWLIEDMRKFNQSYSDAGTITSSSGITTIYN